MVGNLVIQAQACKPAIGQVQTNFFHQFPVTADAVEIPQNEPADENFRIDRRTDSSFIEGSQSLAHKSKIHVTVYQPQQVMFRNLVFQAKVVKQRVSLGNMAHHRERSSWK